MTDAAQIMRYSAHLKGRGEITARAVSNYASAIPHATYLRISPLIGLCTWVSENGEEVTNYGQFRAVLICPVPHGKDHIIHVSINHPGDSDGVSEENKLAFRDLEYIRYGKRQLFLRDADVNWMEVF